MDRGACARAFELSHGPYPGVYQSLACAVSRIRNALRPSPRPCQKLAPRVHGGDGVRLSIPCLHGVDWRGLCNRSLHDGMDPYFFVRLAGTVLRMYLLCAGYASTGLASLCHDHCHVQDWMFAPWFGAAPWMTWSPLEFSLQTHRFVRVQDIDFSSLRFVSPPLPTRMSDRPPSC